MDKLSISVLSIVRIRESVFLCMDFLMFAIKNLYVAL